MARQKRDRDRDQSIQASEPLDPAELLGLAGVTRVVRLKGDSISFGGVTIPAKIEGVMYPEPPGDQGDNRDSRGGVVSDRGDFRPIFPRFGLDGPDNPGCPGLEPCKVAINLEPWPDLPEGYALGEAEIARRDDGSWWVVIPLVAVAVAETARENSN